MTMFNTKRLEEEISSLRTDIQVLTVLLTKLVKEIEALRETVANDAGIG